MQTGPSSPTYYQKHVEIPLNSKSFLLHFKPLALGDVKATFTSKNGSEKQDIEMDFTANAAVPDLVDPQERG